MCSGGWGGAVRERRSVTELGSFGLEAGREVSRAGPVDSCWRFRGSCGPQPTLMCGWREIHPNLWAGAHLILMEWSCSHSATGQGFVTA